MKQSDREKLARLLEKQGCRVKQTKNGYMIYAPSGGVIIYHVHASNSPRAMKNIKADVERQGLQWPLKG